MQSPSQLDRSWRNPVLLGAALFLLTAGVYFPAMGGTFIWDDDITLTNNPLVKLPLLEGLNYIWFSKHPTDYYPITWTAFWIEWRIFESNPAGYHIVNILLHAANAVLLWRILARLGIPGGKFVAWCAAALFAVHPIGVDSVAWISQRKNTLSMIFYLAAILAYLRYDDGEGRKNYWAAVIAFAAALLSKSSIIMLPVVLLCLLWFRRGDPYLKSLLPGLLLFIPVLALATAGIFLLPASTGLAIAAALAATAIIYAKRKTAFADPLVRLLPFFILSAAAAFMTIWFQGKVLGYGVDSGNEAGATVKGALGASFSGESGDRNIGDRLLVSGQIYWFYISKLLFPSRVAMVYQSWKVNPGHFIHYLPVLGMVTTIVLSFLFRKKIGRGLCAGLSYIAIALFPVMGFVAMSFQNYSWVANHLCYVAVPGVAATATALAAWLIARLGPASRAVGPLAFAAVLTVFAVQSWKRCGFYQDPERLWRNNITTQPGAHAGWNELGIVLIYKNRLEEAADAFRECIRLKFKFSKPHNNLGTVLSYMHRYEEAAAAFERALWINEYDPDSMGNLGLVYLELGKPEKALAIFERTLELRLMSPATYHNMGLALEKLERIPEARDSMMRAIELDPTNGKFRATLARLYYRTGDDTAAMHHFEIAMQLGIANPNFFNTAAWIMATSPNPALRDGNRALQFILELERRYEKPDPALLRTKAAALAELGRFEEAIAILETLRELAQQEGKDTIVEHADIAIELYRQGQPFRETKPAPPPETAP